MRMPEEEQQKVSGSAESPGRAGRPPRGVKIISAFLILGGLLSSAGGLGLLPGPAPTHLSAAALLTLSVAQALVGILLLLLGSYLWCTSDTARLVARALLLFGIWTRVAGLAVAAWALGVSSTSGSPSREAIYRLPILLLSAAAYIWCFRYLGRAQIRHHFNATRDEAGEKRMVWAICSLFLLCGLAWSSYQRHKEPEFNPEEIKGILNSPKPL